jgi:hypothetical protein
MSTSIQVPTLRIFEDFDKIFAKEVKFLDSGDKIIVSFLNFTNISPEESHRLLMSDDSGEELYQSGEEYVGPGERPRKKSSSSKRLLDQRKASLNKMQQHHSVEAPGPITETPEHRRSNIPHIRHTHHPHHNHAHHERHRSSSRSLQSGYEKYQMSLLSIPMPDCYGDPSSDDLSSASEWDSDKDANDKANNNATNKEVKVRILIGFDYLGEGCGFK